MPNSIWILSNNQRTDTTDLVVKKLFKRGWQPQIVHPLTLGFSFYKGTTAIASKQLPQMVYTRLGSLAPFESIGTVRVFESLGVPIVNSSKSLNKAKDKLALAHELTSRNIPIPDTLYLGLYSTLNLREIALPKGPPWVLKVPRGTKGKGVLIVESLQSLVSTVEALGALGSPVLIQEFVKTAVVSDIRVLVIGGEALGAVRRVAKGTDFRSNLHLGGTVERYEMNAELVNMASSAVSALELYIAGVDIIETEHGYMVLEVNSSPGLNAFMRSGQEEVVDRVISKILECRGQD